MVFDKQYFEKKFEQGGWGEPTSTYETVKYARQLDALAQHHRRPEHILEIGCAEGAFTQMLAQAFPETAILAVDISTSAINRARDRCRPFSNVRFLEADVVNVFHRNELPARAFDAIIQSESLYYLFPRALLEMTFVSYFRGMVRSLKEDGIFLTSNGLSFTSKPLLDLCYGMVSRSCPLDQDTRYTEWNDFRKKRITYDVKVFRRRPHAASSSPPLKKGD
ncbi:MAG: class I SAM-dependent methyltransferase [Chloroflexi bacterium]|nr:class I SAM-dependent methyltransferase [Chloroflexota bacterium]